MKKIEYLSVILLVLISFGCGDVYHIGTGAKPLDWVQEAGQESYKYILVQNQSPFFIKIALGNEFFVLDPGAEVILKRTRPLGSVGVSFGNFSFMAYAYREYKNNNLDWFVGQREEIVNLDGRVRAYDGRFFADRVQFKSSGWQSTEWGHPSKWSGSFLGIIPWNIKVKHGR